MRIGPHLFFALWYEFSNCGNFLSLLCRSKCLAFIFSQARSHVKALKMAHSFLARSHRNFETFCPVPFTNFSAISLFGQKDKEVNKQNRVSNWSNKKSEKVNASFSRNRNYKMQSFATIWMPNNLFITYFEKVKRLLICD